MGIQDGCMWYGHGDLDPQSRKGTDTGNTTREEDTTRSCLCGGDWIPSHRHWLTMWVKWGNSYTCCFFHQIRGSLSRDTFCTLVYGFRSVSTPIDIKNIDAFCHLRGHSKFYVDGLIHSHQKRLPEYPGSHCEGFKTPLQENRYLSLSTMWGSVCWHMSRGEKFVVSRGVG